MLWGRRDEEVRVETKARAWTRWIWTFVIVQLIGLRRGLLGLVVVVGATIMAGRTSAGRPDGRPPFEPGAEPGYGDGDSRARERMTG
jgi:hypothetical protein